VRGLAESSRSDSSAICHEIVRRFEPLFRRSWLRAKPTEDYRDFLHDVLVRLFEALPSMRNPKAFPGFLRRIVLSVVADSLRKRMRSKEEQVDSAELEAAVGAVDHDVTTPIFIRACMERLPPRERQVVELDFFLGLTFGQIAQRLGITPGAVRMTRFRAINRLGGFLRNDARVLKKEALTS